MIGDTHVFKDEFVEIKAEELDNGKLQLYDISELRLGEEYTLTIPPYIDGLPVTCVAEALPCYPITCSFCNTIIFPHTMESIPDETIGYNKHLRTIIVKNPNCKFHDKLYGQYFYDNDNTNFVNTKIHIRVVPGSLAERTARAIEYDPHINVVINTASKLKEALYREDDIDR